MQARGSGPPRPPIGIALEGDFGTRIDAPLAVAMLNGFVSKTEARSIAVCISKPNLKAAQLADVITGFYASRAAGTAGMVGVPDGAPVPDDAPWPGDALAQKAEDGAPRYKSGIARLLDTADNAVLIRNMLLAQHDGNAAIVLAGPATGMARLLALYGSPPQITAKVKHLVVAIGSFPAGPPEASVTSDVAAAKKMFAEWPSPLIAVGAEVGAAMPFSGAVIEKDLDWSPAHPVADAYRAFKPMPYDAPAPALAAMLYAAHPDDGYFTLSEPGTISVQDDGRTRFTPAADGKHRYLIVDPAQKERVLGVYAAMVTAKPVPRPGRGGRGGEP